MKHNYQVIVGNIGIVHEGTNGFEAVRDYNQYVRLSKDNYGRVAGEAVTLMKDDDIHREYYGTLEEDES